MSIRKYLASAATLLIAAAANAQSTAISYQRLATDASLSAAPSTVGFADSGRAQKTFFTRHDLVAVAGAAVVTGGVMVFDQRIRNWMRSPHVQANQSFTKAMNDLTRINETPLTIASVVTYGVGRLTHSEATADVGLHWTEALLLTDVISQAIRGPLGRARPRVSPDDPFKFSFGSGFTHFENRAFPSLHAAVGFATAASLLGEIQVRHPSATPWAAPLLYTFAMVPGLTRMYLDQHWASDVVAGAFIGQLIGNRVVHYAHTHKRTKLDRALLATSVMPDGRGGTLVSLNVQQLFGDGDQH